MITIIYADIIVLTTVFLVTLWIYGKRKYSHFKNTEVKYLEPTLPFIGSWFKVVIQREHLLDFINRNYKEFPDQKYIGIFEGQKPLLYIRDLDLIKQFAVKDFDHFMNHRNIVSEDLDVLFGKGLFSLQGEKWRDMRSTLSPAFTSSKMKNMFQFVEECAKDVVNYYVTQNNKNGKDVIEIEVKRELSKFSNDVIANSAYGIKVNSFEDENNQFFKLGMGATSFKGMQMFKFFMFSYIPGIMKLLGITFLSQEVTQFFRNVVLNTMKYRDENGIVRHDMIHLLMEAKKGSLIHEEKKEEADAGFATVQESSIGKASNKRNWSDDDLVAQAFLFFLGGFETVSTLLSFFFYEMVCNPDIQKKLQDEIDEFIKESNEKFIYNDIPKLKYLDMCVSETLRMWPPALAVDRVCNKTYTLPPPTDSSNTPYQINVGEAVWIPIYGLHHDPKYFPNPDRFDPERFSDENKSCIEPAAFMPFGIGPRNCIGSRFALMEAKVMIFHLLSKFDFIATKKTQIPVIMDNSSVNILAKGGMHLGLKLRTV